MKDKNLKTMMRTCRNRYQLIREIEVVYQKLTSENDDNVEMSEIILDMLNVPKETWAIDNKDGFCRDWLTNIIYDYCEDETSLDEAIKKLKKEIPKQSTIFARKRFDHLFGIARRRSLNQTARLKKT